MGAAVRLSISGKVFTAFVVLLVTFGGVTGYTVWQVRRLGQRVARIQAVLLPLPSTVAELKSDLRGLDLAIEPADPPTLRRSVHLARRVHPYLDRLEAGFRRGRSLLEAPDRPAEVSDLVGRFRELDAARGALADVTTRFFDAVESDGDPNTLRRAVRRELRALGRDLARFELDLTRTVDQAIAGFAREEQRAVWGAIVLASVAMIIGFALALGTGRLLRPLRTLRGGVERIARGQYDQPVEVTGPGELAALAVEFNRMAEAIRRRDEQLSAQQKELLHQERLATVGRMSAQITHELRNPLSSIGLNSELLMEALEPRADGQPGDLEDARGLLVSIIREVERLREITEEYLRFARLPRPERTAVDLNQLVTELLEFLRTELEQAGVRARLDPDRAGRPAFVDPNQVRAALLNLMRNAREALDGRPGHVVVRVRTLGEQATLEVTDDGPGMTPDALAHLFEPFYSTKPQGTGLGLSMVRKIAQAQEGEVAVESAPGRGTTVRLVLPLAAEEAAALVD